LVRERLRTLPVGISVLNTNGYEYTVIAQANKDTLLRRDEGCTRFAVVWGMITTEEYEPESFIYGTFYPSTDSSYIPIPFVTWDQGYYFHDEGEAVVFMQNRHMERTGEKMCYPSIGEDDRCPACQFFHTC